MDALKVFITGGLPLRTQVVAVAASVLLLWGVVHLIRREQLKEGYSIGWFLVGLTMVVFSLASSLLTIMAELIGIAYVPAALLLILIGGLLLLALHFSVLVSRYDRQIRELAQEHAILKQQLEEMQKTKTL